jgi:WD40 repeat protein/transcriptional regulator with XRE-family HTH domain
MNTEESFGRLVRERRRALDLTQEELARRVGCAAVTLRKIEADDLRPSQQIAERLAMALAIPLDERAAFVRLARAMRPDRAAPTPPTVTPTPAPEEIGQEDLSGRAIRGYALGERIGAGGFGVVYRAVQPLVEREVAIKIILPQYANHPEFIRRFEAEAQLVARLEHPHVVPLYDYWREPGVAYLVMRLLRGGSVQAVLQSSGPFPLETVARMLEQIGSALGAAHRAGVVHRDLKPANILLDEDSNAYLADFGIAKNLGNPNLEDQTRADEIIGSPAYFSPEQIRSETVRPQADIYSLGVVLYELLTGARPFQGPTPIDLIQQHLTAPLPPLAAHRAGLPAVLDAVIARATAKDPLDRYPDVETLVTDVRRVVVGGAAAVLAAPAVAPELPEPENPYKGLRAFGEADAADFFGREALTQQLLARMAEGGDLARFLAVVGPSGSGKSSVVGAGLVPALRRGALPGSENWFVVDLLPGEHPLEELEAALLRIAVNPPESLLSQLREDKRGLLRAVRRCLPDDHATELVLVIDQFEEAFTLVQDEEVRAHLLDSLVTAALDERSRVRVVVTLRADFTDRPLNYMDFGELMRQRMEIVLPLTPDELERAIAGPAERAGLTLEPGLEAAIMHDVGDQPGALPLLQYALTDLFEKREGRTLTKAAYQSIGGVLGALSRRAEEVFTGLNEAEQEAARQLFLRLVTLGEGTEDTRRRVLRAELLSLTTDGRPPTAEGGNQSAVSGRLSAVIDAFGKSRLLTFDRDPLTRGPTVEVAHEALLREWGRLREWLAASRADVRLQRQLANAAAEWQSANRDPSFLLTGARLAHFEGWAAASAVALTRDERAFLDASLAERQQRDAEEEARRQRELEAARKLAETEKARAEAEKRRAEEQSRANRRLRQRAVFLSIAFVVAGVLAVVALLFSQQANEKTRLATARELALAALINLSKDPELSILLALRSAEAWSSVGQTVPYDLQDTLHQAVQALRTRLTWSAGGDDILYAGFSPVDGTPRVVTGDKRDGTVKVWDPVSNQVLLTLPGRLDNLNNVALSPDGKYIVVPGDDNTIKIWEVTTGQEWRSLSGHTAGIIGAAYSPDGKLLAATSVTEQIVWEVETGKPRLHVPAPASDSKFLAFSPDSQYFAAVVGDGLTIKVWEIVTGQEVHSHEFSFNVVSFAFNPDGKRVAAGGRGASITVWDTTTGRDVLTLPSAAATGEVRAIAFSPDGSRLVTATIVWDAATGKELFRLLGHMGNITGLAFNADGTRLITGSVDGIVSLWDLSPSHEWLTIQPTGLGYGAAISPDGKLLATTSADKTAVLWDLASGRAVRTLSGHTDVVNGAAFSPDGKVLATIGADRNVILWDVASGELVRTLTGHTQDKPGTVPALRGVIAAAFSPRCASASSAMPGGCPLAAVGMDGQLIVWDALTGQKLLTYQDAIGGLRSVAFSPDGKLLAVGNTGEFSNPVGATTILDAATGAVIRTLPGFLGWTWGVAFSPDGKRLASVNYWGAGKVWDVSTGEELVSLKGLSSGCSASFSPDGALIATGNCDGVVTIWDAQSGLPLFPLTGLAGPVLSLAFSSDGKYLAATSIVGGTGVYVVPPEDLLGLAESRLTRTLTEEECQQYLHMAACPEP